VQRIFDYVEYLRNDTSSESSVAAAASASAGVSGKMTEENMSVVHMMQMLQVLVNQSVKPILKVFLIILRRIGSSFFPYCVK